VRMRVDLANQIRGILKPFGLLAGKGGGRPFMERVRSRRLRRGFGRRRCDNLLNHRRRKGLLPRRTGLVAQQASDARLGEPPLPAPDRRFRLVGSAHDLHRTHTVGAQQHDLCPPHMLLRRVAFRNQPLQPRPILRRKLNLHPGPHRTQIAYPTREGNLPSRSEHLRLATIPGIKRVPGGADLVSEISFVSNTRVFVENADLP
jgi:hypothetical protein